MSAYAKLVKFTFLIAILTAVGQMTQTMYVPAIGQMASEFAVTPGSLQAVMACYLIPYGLSQFVYGPISDRLGRKPIILFGLAVYVLGTLIALFSPNYMLFLAGSFIQGLGVGCGGAMARTLGRDRYSGVELHKVNSLISMSIVFSPLLAPVLGGVLAENFGWRSSYLFLALFGLAVVITMMTSFKETLPKERRRNEKVSQSYKFVMANKRFQGYLICLVATFSGLAIFEAAAGVLLGGVLKLPATTVSILFILPIPGYLVGSAISSILATRCTTNTILNVGLGAITLGSVVILIPGVLGYTSAISLVAGAALYFLGTGIVYPSATTGALTPIPNHAGTGGAVLGGMQNLVAGLATLLASLVPAPNQMPLGIFMLVMSLMAVYGMMKVHKCPEPVDESEEVPLTI
ncbi:multidrug efflux MFS transporter EmrD [Vibrio sp. 404]|uniref:Bcr/CflA family efflux transporter n=1 Tax=Vibrio marinisediminis TaxID=2758441 RepID=A0A7W2FUD5_9VIBR|nr:multidrug efflux MFS transporter EmrD [Vibrio marinisediminis]MBA5764411.1 multidrug efflux MFS transporter EmrD [Vibrio marinisediminis]